MNHLNTPREIYNQAQQLVWRRPQVEPFGDTPPDENPSGLGIFTYPLGASRYYDDTETGMQYAMFRDCYPRGCSWRPPVLTQWLGTRY